MKIYKKWINILNKAILFEGISNNEIINMLACLSPRIKKYTKNEYIAIAGDQYKGIGIVLSGTITISKENVAGSRIIIAILKKAEIFAEMAAFSGQKVWPATIIAQENCDIMFISADKIIGTCEKSCKAHKLLILNMLKILSKKALGLNRKIEYLSLKNLRVKISFSRWLSLLIASRSAIPSSQISSKFFSSLT